MFQVMNESQKLDCVLRKASMKDGNKTVIMTILNNAWAEPNSIFDLFIESFRVGNGTEGLLKHLVLICVDEKAYARCSASYPHCYHLRTKSGGLNLAKEAFFMSPSYMEMVWRKIEFLGEVLEMGYSFVFTVRNVLFFSKACMYYCMWRN